MTVVRSSDAAADPTRKYLTHRLLEWHRHAFPAVDVREKVLAEPIGPALVAEARGAAVVAVGASLPRQVGLFDAQRSRVPVLAIAAQIPREEIGSGYFQETHPQELFRECSEFAETASIPEQLPRLLEIAMRTAIERTRRRRPDRARRGVRRRRRRPLTRDGRSS